MYRILVPLDGALHAECAVGWSEVFARALDAEIDLVGVLPPGDTYEDLQGNEEPGDQQTFESRSDAIQSYLEEVNSRLQEVEPDAEPGISRTACVVLTGDPNAALVQYAKAHAVDLIVIAGHAHTGLWHALRGSVTDHLVRETGKPVISIGPRAADCPNVLPEIVLVPMDDSALSHRILEPLAPLARACASRLVLLRVVPLPSEGLAVQGAVIPIPFGGKAPDPSAADLEKLAVELRAKGIETEVKVVYGDRVKSILEAADEMNAGMIAMATHSLEGIGHWLRRSIAEDVNVGANVPVLEFHPAAV